MDSDQTSSNPVKFGDIEYSSKQTLDSHSNNEPATESLHNRIKQLEDRVRELEESQVDLPFPSRIKYQERLNREEFFYKAFRALSFNKISGDYVEFGSHGCSTFSFAYHQARQHRHKAHLWAFDSFQGFPDQSDKKDEHPKWIKGTMCTSLESFKRLCASSGIPKDAYTIIPGFFADTLPGISAKEPPLDIALAYIDCDLYSSTKDVLNFLVPRLKHGMIVALDDYYCWSATQDSGERVALLESLGQSDKWELVQYVQFGWHGLSFVVLNKTKQS